MSTPTVSPAAASAAATGRPARPAPKGMAWIPAGEFTMGSASFYPEEGPVHRVAVDGFWMDEHPVTVAEFRRFVKATGHVTVAERPPPAVDHPDADPALLVPGSLVFHKPAGPVPLDDVRRWWAWVPGASWRRPEGPGSSTGGRERHPVTHVAYADALAYAAWAGKELPSEAQWEYAARGGLDGAVYPWGDEFAPRARMMANTWQGEFPWQNLRLDRYEGTSPVGAFPPNAYGLFDVVGNVWEWTCDYFADRHTVAVAPGGAVADGAVADGAVADGAVADGAVADGAVADRGACCAPRNPRVDLRPAASKEEAIPRRVIKGGSHLCAPNYCLRYRPAARQGEAVDTSTCHLGFRCALRRG